MGNIKPSIKKITKKIMKYLPEGLEGYLHIRYALFFSNRQVSRMLRRSREGEWQGIILLSGPARVGKSTISSIVANELCGTIIHFDEFRRYYDSLSPENREQVKRPILNRLCSKGKGLIIEGGGLAIEKTWENEEKKWKYVANIDLINELRSRYRLYVVIIGASEDRPKDKLKGIVEYGRGHDCWAVRNLGHRGLEHLSTTIVALSKKLKNEANRYDIPYIDVKGDNFWSSVEQAARNVVDDQKLLIKAFKSFSRTSR